MERDWDLRADELSAEAIAAGRPTEWFDRLYAAGVSGEVSLPWDREDPQVLLHEWAQGAGLAGEGRRAVVVGCGLGADAEYLARLGFEVTAFDVSPTAVALAADRYPGSPVSYEVADLLDLPAPWHGAFDLVVEIFTLQALPEPPRRDAGRGVTSLVAPGGTLLAIQFRYDGTGSVDAGPPFPQTRDLFDSLAADGLDLVALEELQPARWRAELRRPG